MPEGEQSPRKQELQWCELELTLRAGAEVDGNKSYQTHLRFSRPNGKLGPQLLNTPPLVIDDRQLRGCKADPAAYGAALWAMLFGDARMRRALDIANTNAAELHCGLRLRLFIGYDALELHSIWWETLIDPETDSPVLLREDFAFSRYLSSSAGTYAELEPARKPRMLYAVANPADIDQWTVDGRPLGSPVAEGQLLPPDVAGRFDVVTLGASGPVTLGNLVAWLHKGFDILYLVCHGALVDNKSQLYLENEDRLTKMVSGKLFADSLRGMVAKPSLVVLVSCQSAGTGAATPVGNDGELAALGPSLMDAGVPAVLAMQGKVSESTARRFMPVLFGRLALHGEIERAVAVARGAVREQRDWWMPVLFTRLKSGPLWSFPAAASGDAQPGYDWQTLVKDLNADKCVMVLGSGLGEDVLGSRQDIASSWVEVQKLPLIPHKRDGLPQVAQYLACVRNRKFPLEQLRDYLLWALPQRHADLLEGYQGVRGAPNELDALVREIRSRMQARVEERQLANARALAEGRDPAALPYPGVRELAYTQIARLPVTTYVTTNRDNLLHDSLVAEGRQPEVVVCRWKPVLPDGETGDEQGWPPSVFDTEPDYNPSYKRPLVYHVFGNMRDPHTVVLTEDDYFDFLVGLSRNQGNPRTGMPAHVKMVLATHGLMFLGFQFDDWEFRTIFRGVLPREGVEAGTNHWNVAVQVAPDDERMQTPEHACTYMRKYFSQHRKIQVYLGKPEEFLTELSKQWKPTPTTH